ncbi:MAG: hypothetical protein IID40_12085, partial [Planctomycetes bacterium]|nr:hypothetical protein [Planctomycetota bacterium]
ALALQGRLSIKPGTEAEPTVLQAFTVKCAAIGNARLEGDLSEAEAKLRQMVVAAQSSACQAIASDLKTKAEAAAGKVKITTQPKRITDPVDEVGFDLKSKKRQPVTLTARWSTKAFTYQPANGWEQALGEFLAAPQPGAAAPSGPGLKIAIGIGAAAVLAFGGYFGLIRENNGGATTTTGGDQRTAQVTPSPVDPDGTGQPSDPGGMDRPGGEGGPEATDPTDTPQPPSPPAFDKPVDAVRAILVDARLFRAADARRLVRAPADADEQVVYYRLPGLAGPERSAALTRSDAAQSWELADGEEATIRQALAQLAEVLDHDPTAPLTDAAQNALGDDQFTSLIDDGAVQTRVTLAAEPIWIVGPTDDHLVAGGTQAVVVLEAQDGTELLRVDGLKADLQVRDETLSLVSQEVFEQDLIDRVGAALLDAQQRSRAERRTELANQLGDLGASLLADPTDLAQPVASVPFSIQPAGLTTRTFEAIWDRQTLSFSFDATNADGAAVSLVDRVDEVVLACRTLEAINSRPSAGNDWLGRGSRGLVFEVVAPDDQGIWSLAVAAPWVAPQKAPADVPPDGQLLIEAAWPNDNPAPEDLADNILADQAQPDYWPLIEEFRGFQKQLDPRFLNKAVADAVDGANQDANRVLHYLQTDPQHVAPELDLLDGARPRLVASADGALPDTLEVTFRGQWGVRSVPEEIAGDRLAIAIQKGVPPVELTVSFVVSAGVVQVGDTDSALAAFAPTLGKARLLDAELQG